MALAALVVYAVALAIVLLAPTSGPQSSAVVWLVRVLTDAGLHGPLVTYQAMEFLTNVAIIVPLTFLGAVLAPRLSWRDWLSIGFVGASAVEITQALLLADRTPAFSDIVANTAGAVIGALLALAAQTLAEVFSSVGA